MLCAQLSFAQKTYYDIIAKDKVVGEASMMKNVISDSEYALKYRFDAEITVLFIKTTIDVDISVKYKNSQVITADVSYIYNGKPYITKYVWNGTYYDVTTDGEKSRLDKKAFFSVMNFYDKEPIGINEVFLERQNEFSKLTSLGNNTYEIEVDGDDCTYTYKNGVLQKLIVDAFINIIVVRKN